MPEDRVLPKISACPRYLHIFQVLQKKEKEQMRRGISKNKTAAPQKKLKNSTSAFHTCKNLREIALCFSSYLGYQANHCQDRTRALQV
jgi:hypothetical protein